MYKMYGFPSMSPTTTYFGFHSHTVAGASVLWLSYLTMHCPSVLTTRTSLFGT